MRDLAKSIAAKEQIATMKVWSEAEMRRRLKNLHGLMATKDLDAVILTSIHNVLYVTGWYCPPVGRLHSAILNRGGEPTLIVSTIEDLRPYYNSYYPDVRLFADWECNAQESNLRLWREILAGYRIGSRRIGIEEDSVSVQFMRRIKEELPNVEFVDIGYDSMRQRLVKSEEEITLIRHGVQICEIGGYAAVEALKPGVTEVEVARASDAAIGDELRRRFPNIEYDSLNNKTLFQTGPYRSRVGHIMNAHRVVQKGEMLSNNPYAIIAGYYHVLERSMYWGHIPDDALKAFKVNIRAHHAGLKVLKAGVKCSSIDAHVNAVYEEAGLLSGRSFGTGHSLGIMTYWFGREEGGELRRYNDTVLQENMIVTMEPMTNVGELGGFRHHDICRITKTGIENLNTFPRGVLVVDDNNKLQNLWLPE